MRLLEVKHFSFTYAQEKKQVLEDISFEIEEGAFYLLCGRSGCGKTTLLRHLKTVLAPQGWSEGEIFYQGKRLQDVSEKEQAGKIGFVFQNPEEQFVTDKVWHELAFGLESLGCPQEEIHIRVAEMSAYFGITDWFEKDVSVLSGGQKQIINLASVLVMKPELLILDEPMAQLDPVAASEFLHTLLRIHKEMGVTILLSEHHLEEVFSYADKILVMENGKIRVQGTPVDTGEKLLKENHEMFYSMPTPMRIGAMCGEKEKLPYTVAMGRQWMREKAALLKKAPSDRKNGLELRKRENAVEIDRAWFQYEKDTPWILREASLSVKKGEILALLGGNGAGKSTLLKVIAGFLPLFRGKVFLSGKSLKKYSKKELFHNCLGVLPQDVTSVFVKETVREDLLLMADAGKLNNIVEKLGIAPALDKHPYDLSGGEQQKAALAKVLLAEPRVLLLDEPTKSLDAYYKRELGKLLRDLQKDGVTIFLVSHDIEFCAKYADRAGLYFRGQVEAVSEVRQFFSKNYFYTTITNRMAKDVCPDAIVPEDIMLINDNKDGRSDY